MLTCRCGKIQEEDCDIMCPIVPKNEVFPRIHSYVHLSKSEARSQRSPRATVAAASEGSATFTPSTSVAREGPSGTARSMFANANDLRLHESTQFRNLPLFIFFQLLPSPLRYNGKKKWKRGQRILTSSLEEVTSSCLIWASAPPLARPRLLRWQPPPQRQRERQRHRRDRLRAPRAGPRHSPAAPTHASRQDNQRRPEHMKKV